MPVSRKYQEGACLIGWDEAKTLIEAPAVIKRIEDMVAKEMFSLNVCRFRCYLVVFFHTKRSLIGRAAPVFYSMRTKRSTTIWLEDYKLLGKRYSIRHSDEWWEFFNARFWDYLVWCVRILREKLRRKEWGKDWRREVSGNVDSMQQLTEPTEPPAIDPKAK